MIIQRVLKNVAGVFLVCMAFGVNAQPDTKGDELATAKCGGILDLFAAADPSSTDNKQDLAAAQDRTYNFIMWVHGYLSGRDGIDLAKRPINQQGVTQLVGDIYKVCNNNDQELFLTAVKKIR